MDLDRRRVVLEFVHYVDPVLLWHVRTPLGLMQAVESDQQPTLLHISTTHMLQAINLRVSANPVEIKQAGVGKDANGKGGGPAGDTPPLGMTRLGPFSMTMLTETTRRTLMMSSVTASFPFSFLSLTFAHYVPSVDLKDDVLDLLRLPPLQDLRG